MWSSRSRFSARHHVRALVPIDAGLARPIDRVHALLSWRGKSIDLLRRLLAGGYPMLTTSAGIAVLSEQTATPSQMLTAADQALYAAKAAGRNRVIVSGQTTARVLVAA